MIAVRRTYTPQPGGGGGLLKHLNDVGKATAGAGFPSLSIYRRVLGPHGTVVTEQRWPSIAAYEESREQVRATVAITEIFSRIYPLLASTHVTEVYEDVD